LAANKSDLYQYEDVDESASKSFAKEIGAIFIQTSAKSSAGIDVNPFLLFYHLGFILFFWIEIVRSEF
jgi:hypothetical protein